MKYRPEVDGLRALAVLPVVLFHAGVPGISGGYVGVDIFFVISGYLISRILFDDMQAGRYSLLDFYDRRIRRIFPALLVVVAVSFVFATLLFLPADLRAFTKSVGGNIPVRIQYHFSGGDRTTSPLHQTPSRCFILGRWLLKSSFIYYFQSFWR